MVAFARQHLNKRVKILYAHVKWLAIRQVYNNLRQLRFSPVPKLRTPRGPVLIAEIGTGHFVKEKIAYGNAT